MRSVDTLARYPSLFCNYVLVILRILRMDLDHLVILFYTWSRTTYHHLSCRYLYKFMKSKKVVLSVFQKLVSYKYF